MPIETKITCDYCNADITKTGSYPAYRLHIICEQLPHDCDFVFDVLVRPPIENNSYFCGVACIGEWIVNKCMGKKNDQKNL